MSTPSDWATVDSILLLPAQMLFERNGPKWALRDEVAKSITENSRSKASLPVAFESGWRPHLLMNPCQVSEMSSSRAGVQYHMGTCPHCSQPLLFSMVCLPIAFPSCCDSPRMLGDELATCTQQSCPLFRRALCLDGRHTCRYRCLEKLPTWFTTTVEESLAERIGLKDPSLLVGCGGESALEIIRDAVLNPATLPLTIELQGTQ